RLRRGAVRRRGEGGAAQPDAHCRGAVSYHGSLGPGAEVRAVPAAGVAARVCADRSRSAPRRAVRAPGGRAVAVDRGERTGSRPCATVDWRRVGAGRGLSQSDVSRQAMRLQTALLLLSLVLLGLASCRSPEQSSATGPRSVPPLATGTAKSVNRSAELYVEVCALTQLPYFIDH